MYMSPASATQAQILGPVTQLGKHKGLTTSQLYMNALSSIASLSVEPNRIRALTLDRIQAASATDEVIKGTIEMVLKR